MGAAAGAEGVGLGGEAGLKRRLEEKEQELLEYAVLEGGRGGVEEGPKLAAGDRAGGRRVDGGAEEEVGGGAPGVGAAGGGEDGDLESEEGAEVGEVDGTPRGEGAGVVGAGALVGEDPEVELFEESGEVRKRRAVGGTAKAAHP